jgi:CheY-like chemotaxis protein
MLQSLNCSVTVVHIGRGVNDTAQKTCYDTILMDCRMTEEEAI